MAECNQQWLTINSEWARGANGEEAKKVHFAALWNYHRRIRGRGVLMSNVDCMLSAQTTLRCCSARFFFGGGKTQLTSGWAAREMRWMQINSMICAVIRHYADCVRFFFWFEERLRTEWIFHALANLLLLHLKVVFFRLPDFLTRLSSHSGRIS